MTRNPDIARRQRFLRIVLLLVLAASCGAPASQEARGEVARVVRQALASGRGRFDHAAWDHLLADGVRDGRVDYRYMEAHRAELDAYLESLAAARLGILSRDHLLALLANAYNALTVRSILQHPGVDSIRDIPGVWTVARHRVGGLDLTLDTIEHRILRPFFHDPRIHFALNCASLSCAPLPPWAFSGERIDEQLEERTTAFLGDPAQVRIEGSTLRLSRYFDWYRSDFTGPGWQGAAPTIATYVARHARSEVTRFIEASNGEPVVSFLDYDWSLNDAAAAAGAGGEAQH